MGSVIPSVASVVGLAGAASAFNAPSPTPLPAPVAAPINAVPETGAQNESDPADNQSSAVDRSLSAQETRENNLLRRDRGRAGTVQTSVRGLLALGDQASQTQQRRTLLGE